MKNIITIFFLPLLSFSQNAQIETKAEVYVYIDSIKTDDTNLNYISPSSIEDINVVKENRGIFITLKKNIKLEQLCKLNYKSINKIQNRIFIIDNKIIKHPSKILIDRNEIAELKVINSLEFENQNISFSIIKIRTKSELKRIENNKKKEIRIR